MQRTPDGSPKMKVVLIGGGSSGKTSLVQRLTTGVLRPTVTREADSSFEVVTYPQVKIRFHIFDTAGQLTEKGVSPYLKGADGVFFVYDITDRKSYGRVVTDLEHLSTHDDGWCRMLVGNKSDHSNRERQVSTSEAKALAAKFKIPFMETSALANTNVDEMFHEMGILILEKYDPTLAALLRRDDARLAALLTAVRNAEFQNIRALLDLGVDPNAKGSRPGETFLHEAASIGNIETCAALIAGGADVNRENEVGQTPLHLAAKAGFFFLVSRLLECGGKINHQDEDGSTPLHLAASHNSTVPIILNCGSTDCEIKNNSGKTAEELVNDLKTSYWGPLAPHKMQRAVVEGDIPTLLHMFANGAHPDRRLPYREGGMSE